MSRLLFRKGALIAFRRMASTSTTPMEDAIRLKVRPTLQVNMTIADRSQITDALKPTLLEIRNDSHLHSHHKAMQGVTSKETHFAVNIISNEFQSKMQPARHRMVYALLKDELEREGGIHALQLRTKTPAEEEKLQAKSADT